MLEIGFELKIFILRFISEFRSKGILNIERSLIGLGFRLRDFIFKTWICPTARLTERQKMLS